MYSGTHHDPANTAEQALTDFNAYSVGFCYAAVCSSMGADETLRRLDAEFPADWGVWKPAEEQFRPPKGYVCQCDQSPETHKHYLFKREQGRDEMSTARRA